MQSSVCNKVLIPSNTDELSHMINNISKLMDSSHKINKNNNMIVTCNGEIVSGGNISSKAMKLYKSDVNNNHGSSSVGILRNKLQLKLKQKYT